MDRFFNPLFHNVFPLSQLIKPSLKKTLPHSKYKLLFTFLNFKCFQKSNIYAQVLMAITIMVIFAVGGVIFVSLCEYYRHYFHNSQMISRKIPKSLAPSRAQNELFTFRGIFIHLFLGGLSCVALLIASWYWYEGI